MPLLVTNALGGTASYVVMSQSKLLELFNTFAFFYIINNFAISIWKLQLLDSTSS